LAVAGEYLEKIQKYMNFKSNLKKTAQTYYRNILWSPLETMTNPWSSLPEAVGTSLKTKKFANMSTGVVDFPKGDPPGQSQKAIMPCVTLLGWSPLGKAHVYIPPPSLG
jgi:hypothetical protein